MWHHNVPVGQGLGVNGNVRRQRIVPILHEEARLGVSEESGVEER